ncbi:hypothetical protein UM93_16075 [Psychromicrobium lacuslunae]|uniref:Uncharacterized protein n=1 Tax=Psychromicrobium lacuslunae TaxID=1618207 RepID=A0A0D4BWZ9_9MICC|nr:hypothetical protein UM93_02200 [Psychromicrobium lacuslunae]AJT42611.1 hypothetical protein UM93_16075 [Psychromicrobium lacuslunae]
MLVPLGVGVGFEGFVVLVFLPLSLITSDDPLVLVFAGAGGVVGGVLWGVGLLFENCIVDASIL